jgi:hypothetical protein
MIRTIVTVLVFILVLMWIAKNPGAADTDAHNIASFFTGLVS